METKAILAFFKAEIIIFLHYKNIKYEKSHVKNRFMFIFMTKMNPNK